MTLPSRHIDLIVLNGAYGPTLAFGLGFVESSAAPGSLGTTILTGHHDTHFAFLEHVRPGKRLSPAYAGNHSCEAVEECPTGVLRSFGEVSSKAHQGPRLSSRGDPLKSPDGSRHDYHVRRSHIVDSRTGMIRQDQDRKTLVLVTCSPFNTLHSGGPLRYVLIADTASEEGDGMVLR